MHFTSFKSAVQRWSRFKDRISLFEKEGFSQDYNVKISRDYCLMDGLHRLIFAKYYNIDVLYSDIYDCDAGYFSDCIFGQNVLIQEEDLENYFSQEEIRDIMQACMALEV